MDRKLREYYNKTRRTLYISDEDSGDESDSSSSSDSDSDDSDSSDVRYCVYQNVTKIVSTDKFILFTGFK